MEGSMLFKGLDFKVFEIALVKNDTTLNDLLDCGNTTWTANPLLPPVEEGRFYFANEKITILVKKV